MWLTKTHEPVPQQVVKNGQLYAVGPLIELAEVEDSWYHRERLAYLGIHKHITVAGHANLGYGAWLFDGHLTFYRHPISQN